MKRSAALVACILALSIGLPLALAPRGNPTPAAESTAPASLPEVFPLEAPSLRVELSDGRITDMPETEYLTGVLLAELPGDFAPEARKAQAVVSRTYARRRIGSTKHPSGADVCVNPACCQGWVDPSQGDPDIVRADRIAVEDTAFQVLVYEGELIDATFFSCSGGWTEDAAAVWGADVPYLQAVESPGENAPHGRDSVWFSGSDFAQRLGISPEGEPQQWLGAASRTRGGGVAAQEIGGRLFSGTELRRLLGLRSTDFVLEPEDGGITAVTQGYGHRVGMSQYGAQAMALEGKSCPEILLHYYSGAQLENRG